MAMRPQRTGKGQVVDVSLYEAVLGVMETSDFRIRHHRLCPRADGIRAAGHRALQRLSHMGGVMVVIAANQDTVFRRLGDAMGRPELATDPRY